ncbi:MAG TPA: tRNA pseudouridine(38-40) synthase TruA [Terracidiphilus sp.]|jgi:tRNA pseudouridine38-40 synthase|nr:tRNA pseudouridine(38-40) synthase TruA [Terracidiphilus sp.]
MMAAFNPTGNGSRMWKAILSYDGTDYRGWQVQPGERTIQGELQDALGRVTGESPLPQGSGRTDAGVHALGQVASFPLQAAIPPENLLRALNRTLPASIRVMETQMMPSGFHARHSAVVKTYEYRVWIEKVECIDICPPFMARYVYACPWNLDRAAMQQASAIILGEHDFVSFCASDPDLSTREQSADLDEVTRSTVRNVFASTWEHAGTEAAPFLIYRIRGNGFLHHMVRNLVGTMIEVGRGATKPSSMHAIFEARSRSAAGPTAPARGLFLHSVEYD